jgi:tellurite resistance protein
MNDATKKILSSEEIHALIRRQKEMTEKLEASLRGGVEISSSDIAQAQEDVRRIVERIRSDPDFREAFEEVNAFMIRQMEAIRHLHDEEEDNANERPRSLH